MASEVTEDFEKVSLAQPNLAKEHINAVFIGHVGK